MPTIRLANYNILNGCFETSKNSTKISKRFDLLQNAIKEINADFIGLIDTYRWQETFTEDLLRNIFGYKHVFCIDIEDARVGKNIGVAVLTNLDVKNFNIIHAHNRNYIETVLEGLNIYTCYLDDLSEDTRLLEIKSLIEQAKQPAIIHGDFNSFTREDKNEVSNIQEEFILNVIGKASKLKPIVDDMKRGEVVDTLKSNGFIDAEISSCPTMPTPLFSLVITKPIVRVDYIFHSKEIKVAETKVHTDSLFDAVSDHYPLSTTITW